jgi:hypothetical protein
VPIFEIEKSIIFPRLSFQGKHSCSDHFFLDVSFETKGKTCGHSAIIYIVPARKICTAI